MTMDWQEQKVAHLCKGNCKPYPQLLCSQCRPDTDMPNFSIIELCRRVNELTAALKCRVVALFHERDPLIMKQLDGDLDAEDADRLRQIEKEIDDLEAIELGPDLANLEKRVRRQEEFAKKVTDAAKSVGSKPTS